MPIPQNKQLQLQGFLYSPDTTKSTDGVQVSLRVPENIPDDEITNITEDIANGETYLYNKHYGNVKKFAKDSDGNIYEFARLDSTPYYNNQYLTPIPFSEVSKKLPHREFVGGNTVEQARINMIKRIPGFTESVWKKAQTYGVDPNLILRRFIKEGFADQLIRIYNGGSAAEQADFPKNPETYLPLDGYGALGLDYVGDELAKGLYELKDSTATWEDYGPGEDNEGSDGHRTWEHSVAPHDLNSAITLMMSVPDAELFTNNNYKMMYPGFDQYAGGGLLRKYEIGGPRMTKDNHTGTRYEAKRQEYIQKKQDEMRLKALENSRNRQYAEVPILRYENGEPVYGFSCIWTGLNNYGEKYMVPQNEAFRKNPQAYGFVPLDNVYDALPGDLVQGGWFYEGNQYNQDTLFDSVGLMIAEIYLQVMR